MFHRSNPAKIKYQILYRNHTYPPVEDTHYWSTDFLTENEYLSRGYGPLKFPLAKTKFYKGKPYPYIYANFLISLNGKINLGHSTSSQDMQWVEQESNADRWLFHVLRNTAQGIFIGMKSWFQLPFVSIDKHLLPYRRWPHLPTLFFWMTKKEHLHLLEQRPFPEDRTICCFVSPSIHQDASFSLLLDSIAQHATQKIQNLEGVTLLFPEEHKIHFIYLTQEVLDHPNNLDKIDMTFQTYHIHTLLIESPFIFELFYLKQKVDDIFLTQIPTLPLSQELRVLGNLDLSSSDEVNDFISFHSTYPLKLYSIHQDQNQYLYLRYFTHFTEQAE